MCLLSRVTNLAAALGILLSSACAQAGTNGPIPLASKSIDRVGTGVLRTPALIAFDKQRGELVYFPLRKGPSDEPRSLSGHLGIHQGYAMAANGSVIIIANYSPPEIVTYDVKTGTQTTLHDTYGNPIDVTVDKHGNIYALNFSLRKVSVAVFSSGSSRPSQLTCEDFFNPSAVAADNEGDLFINTYGPAEFTGVVEFPAGANTCKKLNLQPEQGYPGGVGVDPKTDDLIVVDNPDYCAGGSEGEMFIYRKPYRPRTVRTEYLNPWYCDGTFRLDANSTKIFVGDSGYIDQRSYPDAQGQGRYTDRYPANTGGFTTIPNTLPN